MNFKNMSLKNKILLGLGIFVMLIAVYLSEEYDNTEEYNYTDSKEVEQVEKEVVEKKKITDEDINKVLESYENFDKIHDSYIKVEDSFIYVSMIIDQMNDMELNSLGDLIMGSFETRIDKEIWSEYFLDITLQEQNRNGKIFGVKAPNNDKLKWERDY